MAEGNQVAIGRDQTFQLSAKGHDPSAIPVSRCDVFPLANALGLIGAAKQPHTRRLGSLGSRQRHCELIGFPALGIDVFDRDCIRRSIAWHQVLDLQTVAHDVSCRKERHRDGLEFIANDANNPALQERYSTPRPGNLPQGIPHRLVLIEHGIEGIPARRPHRIQPCQGRQIQLPVRQPCAIV